MLVLALITKTQAVDRKLHDDVLKVTKKKTTCRSVFNCKVSIFNVVLMNLFL